MENLLERSCRRVLIADGAMGTLLSRGGDARTPPEEILLTDFDAVVRAHREYAEAGADVLVTNTYGAGAMKLREYGLEQKQPEIVARAVDAARRGAGERDCLIAGSIGPLGNYLEPFGRVTTSAARACFAALARLLAGHGVDCIALETFTDLRELRIAASAVRETLPRIPLIMSMSFDKALRTVTGSPVEVLADVSGAFAPGFAGINCGASLEDNEAAAIELLRHSSLPVSYQPNAGIPVSDGGEAHWPATPADLADSALRVCLAGAALVGSCCGSSPDHTRAIADAVKGMPAPASRHVAACSISSRIGRVVFGNRFIQIGERINPTGRPRLAASVREGSTGMLRRSAARQFEAGSDVLDLNTGVGDPALEAAFAPRAVRALDGATCLPFLIDSPLPEVVEAALPEYPARTFVNSIPCIESRLERSLPLVKLHGAGFVALLLDENGVPDTAAGRIALLERILRAAEARGLCGSDILVDPVVLSEAADPGASIVTLETIRAIETSFGLRTVIGLSNVSFGLPGRSHVNRAFLVQAVSAGLSAAIMDPEDCDRGLLPAAARMLKSAGAGFQAYTSIASGQTAGRDATAGRRAGSDGPDLGEALRSGDPEEAGMAVRKALESSSPAGIVSNVLIPAVTSMSREYEEGRLFLPQLLAGAEALKACFDALRDVPGGAGSRGAVLMATVEGDVHDIGKNIVSAILAGHGWRIVDLGRSVSADRILEAARREAPVAIGLSALLTPSLPVMAAAVSLLKEGLDPLPLIMVGGAVVTPEFAQELGVRYGRDGVRAAGILEGFSGEIDT